MGKRAGTDERPSARKTRGVSPGRTDAKARRHVMALAREFGQEELTLLPELGMPGFDRALAEAEPELRETLGEAYGGFRTFLETGAMYGVVDAMSSDEDRVLAGANLFLVPVVGRRSAIEDLIADEEGFKGFTRSFKASGVAHRDSYVLLCRTPAPPSSVALATPGTIRVIVDAFIDAFACGHPSEDGLRALDEVVLTRLGDPDGTDPADDEGASVVRTFLGLRVLVDDGWTPGEPADFLDAFEDPFRDGNPGDVGPREAPLIDPDDDGDIAAAWAMRAERLIPPGLRVRGPYDFAGARLAMAQEALVAGFGGPDATRDGPADLIHYCMEDGLSFRLERSGRLTGRVAVPPPFLGHDEADVEDVVAFAVAAFTDGRPDSIMPHERLATMRGPTGAAPSPARAVPVGAGRTRAPSRPDACLDPRTAPPRPWIGASEDVLDVVAAAKDWIRLGTFDEDARTLDEAFDAGLVAAGPPLIERMGEGEYREFLKGMIDAGCGADVKVDTVARKGVAGTATLFALPVRGRGTDVARFMADDGAFGAFVDTFVGSGLARPRSHVEVCRHTFGAEDMARLTPWRAATLTLWGADRGVGPADGSADLSAASWVPKAGDDGRQDDATTRVVLGRRVAFTDGDVDYLDVLDPVAATAMGLPGLDLEGDVGTGSGGWSAKAAAVLEPFGLSVAVPVRPTEEAYLLVAEMALTRVSSAKEMLGIAGTMTRVTCEREGASATFRASFGDATLPPLTIPCGPFVPDPSGFLLSVLGTTNDAVPALTDRNRN